MRPILANANVKDEILIAELYQIVLRENERLSKSKGSRNKVNQLELEEEKNNDFTKSTRNDTNTSGSYFKEKGKSWEKNGLPGF